MPTTYRIEVSPNNRAGCKNAECKKNGVKIEKGELRFGNLVEIKDHQSWHWKHWGCVTPLQLDKWWNEIAEQDLDLIDGYDELPDDFKEKVQRGLEQGHVDDDEWNGDIEKNRPGQKGMRTPMKKKSKATEEDDDEDKDAASPSKPPSKPASKKRARSDVKEEAEEDDDIAPEPKASKGRGRPKKAKLEASDKPAKKAKTETSDVPAKKRGRPAKSVDEPKASSSSEPKKGRGRPKKDGNTSAPKAAPPAKIAKGRGRPKKAKGRGRPKKTE